jgi:mannose-6-phosphate isomerase-like protein (cupin superfamily)|tara:strand:+ start:1281 stop:1613 length:333 start_codon:yes stop_codon:yes gene_type:complete
MKVTRLSDAKAYDAELHYKMEALRLQGLEASPADSFSVGLSYFLPGGGAEMSGSSNEKVYVLLEGEVTVITEDGETTLGPLDSCYIGLNEKRAVENRSNQVATMLVIVSS